MCGRCGTFVALALFLISFCDSRSESSECTQLEPCVCRLSDGYYYNLTGLADKELFRFSDTVSSLSLPTYRNTLIGKDSSQIVYFHPCKNIPISTPNDNVTCGGNGVSLCMYDKSSNQTQILGTVQDTQMKLSDDNDKILLLEIHHVNTTSIVNIACDPYGETKFIIDPINPNTRKYHFMLASPYGCRQKPHNSGLSTGSVLVILFFTFGGIYFIGGAVALKTLRGATGWEMLPNHAFWCELPSLVRDGIVFTFNCCRADSYERI